MPAAAETLSVLATLVTIAYFLAPAPAVWRMHSTKQLDAAEFFPFVAMFINCALWTKYGLLLPDSAIFAVNSTGLVLAVIYIGVYYLHAPDHKPLDRLLLAASAIVYPVLLYTQLATRDSATTHAGLIACVCSVVMYGSPLAALRRVIAARSAAAMSAPVVALSLAVTILWTMYGFEVADANIIVPNVLGLVLAVASAALMVFYGGSGGSIEYARVEE
ncbi:sugar efflux transporter for intercellular exchange-domain-containing protein [Blastocladiella britannica]|nr:sugar efflux transporter for intercellular exchange-domain-containing protein [Blastocladiella britannica]